MWSIHNKILFNLKREEILTDATTHIDFENIMQSDMKASHKRQLFLGGSQIHRTESRMRVIRDLRGFGCCLIAIEFKL